MNLPQMRTRAAGALVAAGLLAEWITLHWPHPTAFLVFVGVGGGLLGLGLVLFTSVLVRP